MLDEPLIFCRNYFYKTMQHKELYEDMLPARQDEAKAMPVNKKGEFLDDNFVQTKLFKATPEGYRNVRVTETLNKMAKFNLFFLKSHHDSKDIHKILQSKNSANSLQTRVSSTFNLIK